MKLFCVPYAGGSAVVFNSWKKYLDPRIELIPIELAGRGKRIQHPFYDTVEDAVDDIFNIVKSELTGVEEYAFFGHSMGGMLIYELAQKIKQMGIKQPKHLIFSGRNVPHILEEKEKDYHLLDEENFRKKIIDLGGTPPEFFEYPELLELFIPLLRNDFRLAAVDYHKREITPFDCNISIFVGKTEDMTAEQIDGWKDHTMGVCSTYYFNGGHFFLHDEVPQMMRLLNNTLLGNLYEDSVAYKEN